MSGRTDTASGPLLEYEKCIMQLLLSKGAIEDTELAMFLQDYQTKYKTQIGDLNAIFKKINNRMRHLSLEIRSVVEIVDDNESESNSSSSSSSNSSSRSAGTHRVISHGIVNIVEDNISKQFGSILTTHESSFLADLCIQLYSSEKGCLATADIYDDFEKNIYSEQISKWDRLQLATVLTKLESLKWLKRTDQGWWTLGTKAFLELRTFVEASIKESDGTSARTSHEKRWPQILLY